MLNMKDSGIEWIGEIPKDWKVIKAGRIGEFSTSSVDKLIRENEKNIKLINYTDVYKNTKKIINNQTSNMIVTATKSQKNNNNLLKGDLLFTPSSESINDIGYSALINEDLKNTCYSYHLLRLRFSLKIDDNYKRYLFNNTFVLNQFSQKAKGTTRKTLGLNDFKSIKLVLPSLEEQIKIANFLDEKCDTIDELTKDIQSQIETLENYKKSIITEAVTKGLNPNVEMKGSKTDWIQDIPKGWDVSKVKYLFSNCKGLSITKTDLIEEGLPVISYGQIHSKSNTGVKISDDLIRYVSFSYQEKNPQCRVYKNDFIFADTSEDFEGCGNAIYKRDDNLLYAGYHSIILHSKENRDNSYFAYLFRTDKWRKQLRELAAGVKVYSITQKILINAQIIIPSEDEQKEIVQYLDDKCRGIDSIITDKKKQLEVLEQYKKSIIYEYVTGKKEVI